MEYQGSETYSEHTSYERKYTPAGGGNAFQGFASGSDLNKSTPGRAAEISGSTTIKSARKSSRESLYFGDGYHNPFGGLISQINWFESSQLLSTSTNPTGTFV